MRQTNEAWAPVLDFWFPDQSSPTEVPDSHMHLWFRKSEATDRTIESEFGMLVRRAMAGDFASWHDDPLGRLAKIILLDQMTRNIFRGTPQSFAADPLALDLATGAIAAGMDRAVPPNQRLFFYLPLEHDERPSSQARCLELVSGLADEVPEAHRKAYDGFYDYAVKHRDVIARFGRFPHRNAILGRTSTKEELAFLKQPGSRF